MDDEFLKLVTQGGSGLGVGAVVTWAIGRAFRRSDTAEQEDTQEVRATLKTLVAGQYQMQRSVDAISQSMGSHAATVAEVKARVDGMSVNYGSRISGVEKMLERLDERIEERTGRK
jgi:phage shock protein A